MEIKFADYVTDDEDRGVAGVIQVFEAEQLYDPRDQQHIAWKYAKGLSKGAFSIVVHLVQRSPTHGQRVHRVDTIYFNMEVFPLSEPT